MTSGVSMISVLESVSSIIQVPVLALKNEADNIWDYYYVNEFIRKNGTVIPYNTLKGYRITDYLTKIHNGDVSIESFALKFGKDIYLCNIEWPHDNYFFISAKKDF